MTGPAKARKVSCNLSLMTTAGGITGEAFSADGMRMVRGSLSLQDEIVLCGKSHTGAPTPNPPAL